jgi:hypothetical protein
MNSALDKLLKHSSLALSSNEQNFDLVPILNKGGVYSELRDLLSIRNGFFAFEKALHIYPLTKYMCETSLLSWNGADKWRHMYPKIGPSDLFFGQDIFGMQFCLRDEGVFSLDVETGEFEMLALTLEAWAQAVLDDYEYLTGYPVAHAWQQKYGSLAEEQRLCAKIPFVAGGDFKLENLFVCSSLKAIELRADIASQIRNMPDGAKVRIRVSD